MTAESAAARVASRERDANDFYTEPPWAVEALLAAERFRGTVYDPACGSGNIVEVCRAAGLCAYGTDLIDRRGQRYGSDVDFTREVPADCLGNVDNVISNPPFKHAERFVENGLLHARHKVALLVRLAFLEGQRRRTMFEATPLARVLVFSRRISMPPGDRGIVATGGAVAFCWLVWDHDHRGPATVGFLV